MSENVTSQARFIGGLALVLGVFAVAVAIFVLAAAAYPPA